MTGGTVLRAEVEAASLRGLATVSEALLHGDPDDLTRVLEERRLRGSGPFPWLPGLLWSALEPLGVAPPLDDEEARVLARLLVGAPADTETLSRSIRRAGRNRAGTVWEPLPPGPDLVMGLWRRALVTATAEWWDELAATYARLRPLLLAERWAEASAMLASARVQLRQSAERVAVLAHRVSGTAPVVPREGDPTSVPDGLWPEVDSLPAPRPAPEPTTPPAPQPPRTDTAPLPPVPPAPSGLPRPARGAVSRTVDEAPRRQPSPLPPPEDVEWREVRERRWAPFVFVAIAMAAAVYVLYQVLTVTAPAGP